MLQQKKRGWASTTQRPLIGNHNKKRSYHQHPMTLNLGGNPLDEVREVFWETLRRSEGNVMYSLRHWPGVILITNVEWRREGKNTLR